MALPKPPSSWRIMDLLKIQFSPKQSPNPSSTNLAAPKCVYKCSCCGTMLVCADGATKYRCSQCHTTTMCTKFDPSVPPELTLSYSQVKALAERCLAGPKAKDSSELRVKLAPLSEYLTAAFGSISCLNGSFKSRRNSRRAHYSSCNLDLREVRKTYALLLSLPSKQPLYCALSAARATLKRLPLHLADDPRNIYWVVILFEIPILNRALTNSDKRPLAKSPYKSMGEVPEIQALCYDILKRILGIFCTAHSSSSGNYLASWFSKLSTHDFSAKVDLVNLYITFHLKKYFYYANNPELSRRKSSSAADGSPLPLSPGAPPLSPNPGPVQLSHDDEFFQYSYLKDAIENPMDSPGRSRVSSGRGSAKKKQDAKVKIHQYGSNFHLRTAAGALAILAKANYIRQNEQKVPIDSFYNSLVDYVNIKLDFDSWSSKKKRSRSASSSGPALQTIIDYVHGAPNNYVSFDDESRPSDFYFCQYPFLISLGGKISILEYEARRQMERKAEEAFINSLDKRVALDVYFKVKVRREHIVQDSLSCIRSNQSNLKKSLRVQFINEPGVDAGGLKKEWFLLLTKAIFSPQAGILHNVEDSNFLWFNVVPSKETEVYYLFGAVLGLAIYNSTILDLKFPLTLYKILLGSPVGLADYKELFCVSAENLFKLRDYTAAELEAMALTFDVTYSDREGKYHRRDLVEGGSEIAVTVENREVYIDHYARFFLFVGIERQLEAFKAGFSSVVDGNAFSLFSPEEIQLLLCGSEQTKIDVDVLKSVTTYSGWNSKQEALESNCVSWFWEYLSSLTYKQQKLVLQFLTGSDRVPATGIQNLSLKISRLNNGKDSDRLPVAHTCFNQLAIYEYSSKEKLVDKLHKAVNMSAGFGIK